MKTYSFGMISGAMLAGLLGFAGTGLTPGSVPTPFPSGPPGAGSAGMSGLSSAMATPLPSQPPMVPDASEGTGSRPRIPAIIPARRRVVPLVPPPPRRKGDRPPVELEELDAPGFGLLAPDPRDGIPAADGRKGFSSLGDD